MSKAIIVLGDVLARRIVTARHLVALWTAGLI